MSLNGIRLHTSLIPSTSVINTLENSANSFAASSVSFTPSINAISNIVARRRLGRALSVSINPCLSSSMVYLVVGTNFFLNSSFAACTLHAKMHGES